MPIPTNILIHEFSTSSEFFDIDGDQLLGFYYQFTDEYDQPVSGLIGPYRNTQVVEKAALKAFNARDF